MRSSYQCLFVGLLSIMPGLAPAAQAHLIVTQHGTLNFVDDGAFIVLSLPATAFPGADDDGDRKLSAAELSGHRDAIVDAIVRNVTLARGEEKLALQGILLSPVVAHGDAGALATQLTVTGRFALRDGSGTLRFGVGLYGAEPVERSLEITATRRSDQRRDTFELTPAQSSAVLFSD